MSRSPYPFELAAARAADDRQRVYVTVHDGDWSFIGFELWRGRSVAAIRRAAHKAHPGCKLLFGIWF